MDKTKKVFLACSWFSKEEAGMLEDMRHGLANNKTVGDVYFCLDHQYKDIDVTVHPEVAKDADWQYHTFKTDVDGLKDSDVMAIMMYPNHEDSGAAFEMGMAYNMHKPIVLVLPNKMWQTDNEDTINLMLAKGATDVIKMTDLLYYDFNHVGNRKYPFGVY